PPGQTAANRDLVTSREQPGHEWQEGVETGRQVDVHVGDDGRVAGRPGSGQGTAPTLLLKVDRRAPRHPAREPLGNPPRRVGADVVGHGNPSRKWEPLVEIS